MTFWGPHWGLLAVAAPIIIFGVWAFIDEVNLGRDEATGDPD